LLHLGHVTGPEPLCTGELLNTYIIPPTDFYFLFKFEMALQIASLPRGLKFLWPPLKADCRNRDVLYIF
jgi:hypothetical protein